MNQNYQKNSIKGVVSFSVLFFLFLSFIALSLGVLFWSDSSSPGSTPSVTQANVSSVTVKGRPTGLDCAVEIIVGSSDNSPAYHTATGVLYSSDGYIITNDHIYKDLKDPRFFVKTQEGEYYEAAFVGGDGKTDVALLKIDGTGFPIATFSDSSQVQSGDEIFCIGSPACEELSFSLSKGIVSAVSRRVLYAEGYSTSLIQMDAAVNPGCSGGPVLDSVGRVIGITTSKITQEGYDGIGFCIPSNTVLELLDQLKQNGKVVNRGKLGISYQLKKQKDAVLTGKPYGLEVLSLYTSSTFYGSGLQRGDIIRSINGTAVSENFAYLDVLDSMKNGDPIQLVVQKPDGSEATLNGKAIQESGYNSFFATANKS